MADANRYGTDGHGEPPSAAAAKAAEPFFSDRDEPNSTPEARAKIEQDIKKRCPPWRT